MKEEQTLIVDTTTKILTDLCTKEIVDSAENGKWSADLWRALEGSGLTLAGIPERLGGSDGSFGDALLVLRESAKFAAPLPLAETIIASTLLAEVDGQSPLGAITVGTGDIHFIQGDDHVHISGTAEGLQYFAHCDHWLLVNQDAICLMPRQENSDFLNIKSSNNLAGEPIATLKFNQNVKGAALYLLPNADQRLEQLGAISRVQLMSGAMTSMLAMSVAYALEREQFGRPISRFQAIQQQLAVMAGEVAACQRAADSLLEDTGMFNIAVAKSRVGDAVNLVTDIAHQVHGAMGYTLEHPLNLRSRRLWTWRNEYGAENIWQARLGAEICMAGADSLWSVVTAS